MNRNGSWSRAWKVQLNGIRRTDGYNFHTYSGIKIAVRNIFGKKNQKKVKLSLEIEKKYVSLHRIIVFRPKKLTINNNENNL